MKPYIFAGVLAVMVVVRAAGGHCDTMDGPVVKDARVALEKGDVSGVLKWVGKGEEAAIREAFAKTMAVRGKGAEARELADLWFFETLVRIHRAGEGATYTGLKPAGTKVDPAVAASDKALESGSGEAVVRMVVEQVEKGIREKFQHAAETKKHAGHGVEAGREFVKAYVEFVHYVERVYQAATTAAGHEQHEATGREVGGHEH